MIYFRVKPLRRAAGGFSVTSCAFGVRVGRGFFDSRRARARAIRKSRRVRAKAWGRNIDMWVSIGIGIDS